MRDERLEYLKLQLAKKTDFEVLMDYLIEDAKKQLEWWKEWNDAR